MRASRKAKRVGQGSSAFTANTGARRYRRMLAVRAGPPARHPLRETPGGWQNGLFFNGLAAGRPTWLDESAGLTFAFDPPGGEGRWPGPRSGSTEGSPAIPFFGQITAGIPRLCAVPVVSACIAQPAGSGSQNGSGVFPASLRQPANFPAREGTDAPLRAGTRYFFARLFNSALLYHD